MRRPEPCGQRQLRTMHHRAGGGGSLAPAIEAFVKTRTTLQGDGAPSPAAWTNEALGPALREQERSATCLVGEFPPELLQRASSPHCPRTPPTEPSPTLASNTTYRRT